MHSIFKLSEAAFLGAASESLNIEYIHPVPIHITRFHLLHKCLSWAGHRAVTWRVQMKKKNNSSYLEESPRFGYTSELFKRQMVSRALTIDKI